MPHHTTHERLSSTVTIKASSDRVFGLVFAAAGFLVATWPLLSGEGRVRPWAAWGGAAFLLLSLLAPRLLRPLNQVWTRVGQALHTVTNPLILGAVFFLVITPSAVIRRLLGKDSLQRRFDPDATTYWIPRQPETPAAESMKRQF